MNKLFFTGNLGNDCRAGYAGDTAVLNFSVAMKSGFGDKAATIWVDCALWGKRAEGGLKDILVKGQRVAVTGEMGLKVHEGKTYVTMRVDDIDPMGSKTEGSMKASQQPAPQPQSYGGNGNGGFATAPQAPTPRPAPDFDQFDDDIPFK